MDEKRTVRGPVRYLEDLAATAMLGGVLAVIIWANGINYLVAPGILFFGVGCLAIAKALKSDEEKSGQKNVDDALKGIPEVEWGTVRDGKLHYKHAGPGSGHHLPPPEPT